MKTHVDTGPIAARTFSFLNTGPKEAPAYADKRTQVYTMINEAITRNLAAKGVSNVPSGGDITVAYLVIAGNNATTTSLNDYFGYTDDATKLVDKVHTEQTIKDQDRNYFEEGTLVIDIISPADDETAQANHHTITHSAQPGSGCPPGAYTVLRGPSAERFANLQVGKTRTMSAEVVNKSLQNQPRSGIAWTALFRLLPIMNDRPEQLSLGP